jgi:hypothetical protein
MMASELIDRIEKLINDEGDAEIHIYDWDKKTTITPTGVFFDDSDMDICIEINSDSGVRKTGTLIR